MVVVMERCGALRSEPGGFVFGRCGRTKKMKLYGKKLEHQEYGGLNCVTVVSLRGHIEHRFGTDARVLFGFNPVVDDISSGYRGK